MSVHQRGLTVRLIGLFGIDAGGHTVTENALPGRAASLIKLVALAPDRALHRDTVIETLWPGSDSERGRNNLHKTLHTIRRAASNGNESGIISLRSAMVALGPDVAIDLDEFHVAASVARQSLAPADLLYALGYATGELLPGDIYEDWARPHRDRYRATVAGLRLALAAHYAKSNRPNLAEVELRAMLELDPIDERAHRQLMQLFADIGDLRSALRQYDACASALAAIDLAPSRETIDLMQEITESASVFTFQHDTRCPHIFFARTADDVRIAYHTLGRGFPLVHVPSLPWNNVELEWQVPVWRTWFEQLAEGRMLVRYDNRGQGISDRRDVRLSLETTSLDLSAVVDALGIDRFDVYAPVHASMGALWYASNHPERVRRLVLLAPYARGRDYRDQPFISGGHRLAQDDWDRFCQLVVSNAFNLGREEVIRAVTSVSINSSSPEHELSMMESYLVEDVTDRLEKVTMPTLVIELSTGLGLVPRGSEERVAAALPNSTLHTVTDVPVVPIVGAVNPVIATIHEFLDAPD
jgi:DNA-binding SARP family transcriptional activator/pimeloyl-ACP methyl ester carboxylesterase